MLPPRRFDCLESEGNVSRRLAGTNWVPIRNIFEVSEEIMRIRRLPALFLIVSSVLFTDDYTTFLLRPIMAQGAQPSDAVPRLPEGDSGIAANFPGDAGIENHPAVVFVEDFEQTTLAMLAEQ